MAKISSRKKLSLKDKVIFDKFLGSAGHVLSPYHFCNIYIWKKLFEVFWHIIDGRLCVFFKTEFGCFMYLTPLGKMPTDKIARECFAIMDDYNENKEISRIENVEEEQIAFYKQKGFRIAEKPGDYLYRRKDLVDLRGNNFKSKRSACNYFEKNYEFECKEFTSGEAKKCISLCNKWIKERKVHNSDYIYQNMLEDTFLSQEIAMRNFRELGLLGRIIKINNEVVGYTFGYQLNKNTFCNLFEVCDTRYKGIYQYIFKQFCREMSAYKYINTMDDSGLENLRKVKESYYPINIIRNYIVSR